MEDRSNIIKEAIEYRDKLEKKVEGLAQSVVRLQISLDFADNTIKKKDKENAELKAENARLKSCLQDIKEIAVDTRDCKQYEIDHDCFNDTRCKALREFIETLQEIIDLITKAESEEV